LPQFLQTWLDPKYSLIVIKEVGDPLTQLEDAAANVRNWSALADGVEGFGYIVEDNHYFIPLGGFLPCQTKRLN